MVIFANLGRNKVVFLTKCHGLRSGNDSFLVVGRVVKRSSANLLGMLSTVDKNILHAPSFSMFRVFSKLTVKLCAHVRLFGRERLFRTFVFSFRRQGSSRFIHKTAKRCPLRGKIRYRNSATCPIRSSFPRKSEIHPKDAPIYTQGKRFLISDGGTLGGANVLKDPPAHFSPPPPFQETPPTQPARTFSHSAAAPPPEQTDLDLLSARRQDGQRRVQVLVQRRRRRRLRRRRRRGEAGPARDRVLQGLPRGLRQQKVSISRGARNETSPYFSGLFHST